MVYYGKIVENSAEPVSFFAGMPQYVMVYFVLAELSIVQGPQLLSKGWHNVLCCGRVGYSIRPLASSKGMA